jgi:ParB family chromosome partitioning protein
MARKGMLANITSGGEKLTAVNSPDTALVPTRAMSPAFSGRGAFGAVTRSIDDLAAKAQAAGDIEARLTAGETVVDLDPSTVDDSFMPDRLEHDDQAFRELVDAMRARGQDSPILVRQHPAHAGRYQVAFGHRRLRAARALRRDVRAVVKNLSDRDLLLAQGQENSARADLSFIERSLFAHKLEQGGYDREMIMSALSVDKTFLSRMISVAKAIPLEIIEKIGPAPAVGRGRWIEVASSFETSEALQLAKLIIASPDFDKADSDARFEMLHTQLVAAVPATKEKSPSRNEQGRAAAQFWATHAGERIARVSNTERSFTLAIDSQAAPGFGDYLLAQMDSLYADYNEKRKEG